MNIKIPLFLFAVFLLPGCENEEDKYLVLEYGDFGPQVMAWETLGGQWWQWDMNAQSEPILEHSIHVVVYDDAPISQVQERFPVNKLKQQDFRYLDARTAIRYLNRNIETLGELEDEWNLALKQRLTDTRARIKQQFPLDDWSGESAGS